MKKAIVTIGISGSGKSTFAIEWEMAAPNRVRIERDTIRKALMETDGKKFTWRNWSWKREDEVTKEVNKQIHQAAKNFQDIIISDTNLNESRRNTLVAQLNSLGYEVEFKEFPITIEVAWERDVARENGVGHSVIATQYEQWLKHSARQKYVPNINKPKCILVDIDGTLAHMNGKRGAYEWNKVNVDDLDENVEFIIHSANIHGKRVIILSGRDGCCEDLTKEWLTEHKIVYDELFMRTPNDMRKDTVVKEELFWTHIADKYRVEFVIDDRPVVCRMWRELGLKVFQVGNPHIEF